MEISPANILSQTKYGLSDVRFTIFADSIADDCEALYSQFFGFSFENEVSQKRIFRTELFSVRGNVKCALVQTVGKLDFIVSPEVTQSEVNPVLPQIVAEEGAGFLVMPADNSQRKQFCDAAIELVTVVEGIQRVAVGERYLWHADTKIAAYEKLRVLLPHLALDPAHSSDLHFRINRPLPFTKSSRSVQINRLGDWTAPGLVMMMKVNNIDNVANLGFAAACNTDVNTSQEDNLHDLSPSDLKVVTAALFECSARLADKGDCP